MVRPGSGGAAVGLTILISLGWATASSGFSLFSLLHLTDEATMRYRVEVTLRVDGRLIYAGAVQEMTASSEIRTIPGNGGGISAKGHGEAVVVDIPGRPSLFFLMSGPLGRLGWPDRIIAGCGLNDPNPDPVARLDRFRDFEGPCVLDGRHQPWVIRFDDVHDVSTVHEVLLPERSGPNGDVDLVSVTIERTNEDLTGRLLETLPWLAEAIKHQPANLSVHTMTHGTVLTPMVVLRR